MSTDTQQQFFTATYSPDDNKLRLYAAVRLDKATYERVKAAGFRWAPKQDLFVAPMWTPEREDLLIELCGEIDDEDRSLVDRAEERAERFEGYSERRAGDAERAHAAVKAIADHIPFGQPILVGHHSEKRARKDAERIENGMRKAIKMWDTSKYWEQRAAGAIRHAKYKERPDVRHRRIRGLEANKRTQERMKAKAEHFLALWTDTAQELTVERAKGIANYDWAADYSALDRGTITPAEAKQKATTAHRRTIERCDRWIAHIENRLRYERAMLGEAGGTAADKFAIEIGGRVLVGGEWLVVLRVNRSGGVINSVTTNPPRHVHWTKKWKYGIEEVQDYRAPDKDDAAKVKAATTLPPLCNYPGEGFRHMTKAEYMRKAKDYRYTRDIDATDKHARHRLRCGMFENFRVAYVYLTDVKRVDPPVPAPSDAAVTFERDVLPPKARTSKTTERTVFDAMRDSLKEGVQAVAAPQLFPTPADLAARMVWLADIQPGHAVLEPSAGTGAIVRELVKLPQAHITAIEINSTVFDTLRHTFHNQPGLTMRRADFLQCNGELGQFDRIVMNPPFANAQDIEHILHALRLLKPCGRLVAVCANGPRQNDTLRPLVEVHGGTWEVLPRGTFAASGTGVNAVLLSFTQSAHDA